MTGAAAVNVVPPQAMLTKAQSFDFVALEKELGAGPLRFSHQHERTVQEQVHALTPSELACYDSLRIKWQEKHGKDLPLDDYMILRFARCSPGAKKFNEKTAWKVMKSFDRRFLTLTAASIEEQLKTKTLFPVPGLVSKEGHDVFYMRPARYFPKKTSTEQIIDNLGYCMNTMVEKEKACTEGIAFMAYMNDWKMENFGVNYCFQFMKMLQGKVPVRVRLFLIVNPPGWFGKIWSIMKPMLAADFRKKVHMIPESKLPEFLAEGYQEFLPDDAETGKANTEQMVQDFITYRKKIEA